MIKVLIADDHDVVRAGLRQIIGDDDDMVIAGEASDALQVFEVVANTECDVVLLDITMPGATGLSVLEELKTINPDLPVLILSVHSEDIYGVHAIKANASGYLTKESAVDQLVEAIRKVTEGGVYISPSLGEKLAMELARPKQKAIHETLSDREYQIMRMLTKGHRVTDIANELSLNVKSVSTYRTRLLRKMAMTNNAELTAYAIEKNLIS